MPEIKQQISPLHTKLSTIMLFVIGIICVASLVAIAYTVSHSPTNSFNGTAPVPVDQQLLHQGNLRQFETYEAAQEYLAQTNNNSLSYFGELATPRTMALDVMEDNAAAVPQDKAATGLGGANDATANYSGTNVQVTGVDEADIVKTDGEYLYVVSNNVVNILSATPAENSEIISTIELTSTPQGLFIDGNHMAVFGNDWNIFERSTLRGILPAASYTFFNVYDISDKTKPQLTRELTFQGNYTNARLIDSVVYFITTTYPSIYEPFPLPRVLDGGELVCASDTPDGNRCPYINYFDIPYPSNQLTTVTAVDISDSSSELTREVFMMGGSHGLYVSKNALYIAVAKYFNEQQLIMEVTRDLVFNQLSTRAKERIAKIEATDKDVLSDQEKRRKVAEIIQAHIAALPQETRSDLEEQLRSEGKKRYLAIIPELEKTIIHKVSLDGLTLKFAATGEVPGTILNQFSMDEHNNNFRVATTRNQTWSQLLDEQLPSSNNLFVLDNDLKTIGSIEGIAEGESIYSVRFMQDRAYMVTFERIDPLFVIDVADPTNPQILGELKIPGFSNYLHPYNDELLIGFGQDTQENEFGRITTNGVKLSLFDVSDVANPQEIDTYIASEQSSSYAQHDHHAFLFSREKELLVIPVNAWQSQFNGAMVFSVTPQGFDLQGTIEHEYNLGSPENYYAYGSDIRRSLYIDDVLYTVSAAAVKMNSLSDLSEINTVRLSNNNLVPPPILFDGPVMPVEPDASPGSASVQEPGLLIEEVEVVEE